jgi:hypothetical protein
MFADLALVDDSALAIVFLGRVQSFCARIKLLGFVEVFVQTG